MIVPSSMGKAVVPDAVGKRPRTPKADPGLIPRVYGQISPTSSRCSGTLPPVDTSSLDDGLLRQVSKQTTMLVPI